MPDRPDSLVLPKAESAGDLAFLHRLLDGRRGGRTRPLRVQALMETAAGLARVQEIAAASPRLDALIIGDADLTLSSSASCPIANSNAHLGWRWPPSPQLS